METITRQQHLLFSILIITVPIICLALPALEQEYNLEAYHKDGDTHTLVLKIRPNTQNYRQARQEDEDDDDSTAPSVPATTPWIPAVIPGLTKIFQGIITGNLNDIFHGSSSFAPQNVSHAIDSVYNQVVGIAPPVSTVPTTRRPPPSEQAAAPPQPQSQPMSQPAAAQPPVVSQRPQSVPAAAEPSPAAEPSSAASSPISAGQLLSQGSVVITTTTAKASSNEDDEDEDSAVRFGFAKRRKSEITVPNPSQ